MTKTREQKKLEGTYRLDRDRGVDIPTLEKMPAPDPKLKLSEEAVDIWYSYGNQLIINGLLTFLDLLTFSRYCQLWDRIREMKTDIELNGYFQETRSGYHQVRASYGVLTSAEADILKLEDRFGLNPNARAKIPAQKKEDNNPFKEMLSE